MIQIKLTNEESNTVHVDDITTAGGIHYDNCNEKFFISGRDFELKTQSFTNRVEFYHHSDSLKTLLEKIKKSSNIDCYTLDGRRIVTEKELTVNDIEDTDHVGFVLPTFGKAYVLKRDGEFNVIIAYCETAINDSFAKSLKSVRECVLFAQSTHGIKEFYKFDNSQQKHEWLSKP